MKKDFENEVEELKDFLMTHNPKKLEEEVSIIFDGKQHSIRIPKKFVEVLKIDTKKDSFLFELKVPIFGSKDRPELNGRLVREDG